jgi:hypothetical protein
MWQQLGPFLALIPLTIALGAISTTAYGLLVIAVLAGIIALAAATIWFNRDPIGAFIGMWIFEVLQAPLAAAVGYHTSAGATVRLSSDVLTVLILALAVWRALDRAPRRRLLRYVAPGCLLLGFGMLSAVVNHVSTSIMLQGMWLGMKFWTLLAVAVLLPWRPRDGERVYRALMLTGAVVALLGLVDYFGHGAVATLLHTNTPEASIGNYRANAVQSILSFPGEFSLFMSIMAAVAAARYMSQRRPGDVWLFLLFALSILLSLRLKGVLSLGAMMLVIAFCKQRHRRSNLVPAISLGLLLAVLAFSFDGSVIAQQIASYAPGHKTTARADLYRVGFVIANHDFPLGVGFGRYASDTSRTHYSPVYAKYDLNNVYGLERAYPNYIDDTTWPSIMGEAGYAGLLGYIFGLVVLAVALYRRFRVSANRLDWLPLAGLCTIAVMIVDSLGDPTFFEWRAVTAVALLLGPALALTAVHDGPPSGTLP